MLKMENGGNQLSKIGIKTWPMAGGAVRKLLLSQQYSAKSGVFSQYSMTTILCEKQAINIYIYM